MRDATYGREERCLAIAHRGGAALGPENTPEAFQRAVDMGFTYLEVDVRMTSDGVCVAFHDRSLRRLTGAPGTLSGRSWPQLQRLTVLGRGQVPRIDELLHAWPQARWLLDVKQTSALPALVQTIRTARAADRVCIGGTRDADLARVKEALGPQATTALGWDGVLRLITGAPSRPCAAFAHVPLYLPGCRVPTARLLERARARGLRLVVWGVEDRREIRRLLDEDVDGVITDRIDLLREQLIRRGQWAGGGRRYAQVVP